ncbi:MAG: peptide ABC transporter substrate-binding protein [Candidatus Hydrogenedens sp.]|nr:peptide ABC transporter substrate-binding protein [Candidatus Hydrogenedens sp.]
MPRLRNLPAILCCAALAALTGCSGGSSFEGGNILHVNLGAEVQDLDPDLVTGVPEHRALSSLFEGLTDLDPATMQPVPAVAKSWDISEDATRYTFHLRDDAKWSNGDPVTAKDFAYGWQRILTPSLAAEYAYMLYCIKNAKPFNEGKITEFSEVGVKVIDDHTLEVTLESPTPYFLSLHYHQSYFPIHQATVEKFGGMAERGNRWTRTGNHVGNGAFRLVEWRPDEYIRVEKNPYYWDAASVRLDGIEFTPISDVLTEERNFRAGKTQITETIPLQKIEVYREENPEELMVNPYLGVYFYRINVTRPPLNDVRVRLALSKALDRERLAADVLKAGEQPAYNLTPPDTAGYTSSAKMDYNPEEAKRLLAEAGFPDGKGFPKIELLYNTSEQHKTIAEAVQQMWKNTLNVEIGLYNQDWKVYLDSTDTLNYDLARAAWIGDVVDPMNFLEMFTSYGGNNRTGYDSEVYDQLIEQAYATPEQGPRYEIMRRAEAQLLEDAPIIPVYFYTTKYLKAEEVKGFIPNILDYRRWKDLWLDTSGSGV